MSDDDDDNNNYCNDHHHDGHHHHHASRRQPQHNQQQQQQQQYEQQPTHFTAERLYRSTYKHIGTPSSVENRFQRHLLAHPYSRKQLWTLLNETRRTTRDYSFFIDAFALLEADPVLGHMTLVYPSTMLPLLENSIVQAQVELMQQQQQQQQHDDTHNVMVKGGKGNARGDGINTTRVHARLIQLPPTCCRSSIGRMMASDVGLILQVVGTVVRTSPLQMYESARTYRCTGSKGCGRTFVVKADLEQRNNALKPPDRCRCGPTAAAGSGGGRNNNTDRCQGTKLEIVEGGSVHTDYQEIKIQESASMSLGSSAGHIPRSLLIKLQHDLVDLCQPGDEVSFW